MRSTKGHVTRSNFSCNFIVRNVCCVASCKKQFTYNTPFCNCNCCVASCKKSRTTLYFSQRCETSCCNAILSECANQRSSFARGRFQDASAILFVIVRVASCEKSCKRVTPPLQLARFFLFVIVALQVGRKIASCNMALPPFSLIRDFGKHSRKRFQIFRQSYVLSTSRIEIHQSQPPV